MPWSITCPWLSLCVATRGSSATSHPRTRRSPTDTTDELQKWNDGYRTLHGNHALPRNLINKLYPIVSTAQYIPP